MIYTSNTKKRLNTNYIAVHCSATSPKQDIGAADIDKWHRQKGWACIGYHYVIRRDGKVETGRDESVVGAHVQNFNHDSVGICMVGGIDATGKSENNFTPAQFNSLKTLLKDLKKRYPKAIIQGHRDFPEVNKDCPCFDVKSWVKANSV